MTQSSPSDSFKKRKASLWEASTPGEGALSIFMLHAYKHVACDGLKGTRLMFHGPMTLKHNVNKKTKKKGKKREIEWNLCSLIYFLIQEILSGTPEDNSVSVCSKAAGHSVRGCLDSRVMCDWPQLRKLSLSGAHISSLGSFNSCSTHGRKGCFRLSEA